MAQEIGASCRAKKAADIARATAEDLILQAMEEDDEEEPEEDAADIVDVAAAVAGPAVEDVRPLCSVCISGQLQICVS